jgi:hypothetical protein
MIRSNPNYLKMAEEYDTSIMSTSNTRTEPTDKNMDNLARQDWRIPTGILPNGNLY